MAILQKIACRCYSNFMMPSRMSEYAQLLERFRQHGFESLTFRGFAERNQLGLIDAGKKYLLLRHDIDTDAATSRAMWRIERDRGIIATRFFRLGTIDMTLMQQIEQAGGEAGYHYEELATFAKQHCLHDPCQVRMRMPEIREQFRANVLRLRADTGLELSTAAAHGDFANRRLGIANTEILADRMFRTIVGIRLEAYDEVIENRLSGRHCDRPYPQWWAPQGPDLSAAGNASVVLVLVHPRHWRVNIWCNVKEDLRRLWDGFRFAWGRRWCSRLA